MNRWLVRLFLVGIVAGLGYYGYLWFFPSAENVVRKHLAQVARLASFPHNEGPLAKLANVQKLGGLFALNVEMALEVPGHYGNTIVGRQDLMQAALGARNSMSGLNVDFPEVSITMAPDRQSAVANVLVIARTSGEREPFIQQMKFDVEKLEDGWFVTRIESVRTLR